MKTMKKIGAILLAIMMIAMVGTAWALDTEDEGVGTSGTAITSFTIPKDIVLFNTDTQNIYEPNITFTYSLVTQNPDTSTTITDKNGVTGTVKTGVEGLVKILGTSGSASTSTASLQFGTDTSAASATYKEGTAVTPNTKRVATRNLTVSFDTTVLGTGDPVIYPSGAAGIYRFKITDTTPEANLTAAGIERDATKYDEERYLDVYVEWANAEHTALQVYGYVLYKTTDSTNTANGTTSFKYDNTKTTFVKVTGYNVESEMLSTDGSTNPTSDEYHTYNLKVSKTTTGSMADLNHEFPVSVSFTNSTVTSQTDFYSIGDFVNARLALSSSGAYSVNTDFAPTPSVKNGDTFTFVGLPVGTQYLVNEKNNTVDSYKVTILDDTTDYYLLGNATDGVIVNANGNTGLTNAVALGNLNGSTYESEDVKIINKLDAISPTGYVTRFAPYALILIGGVALLVIAMKKRKHTEED